MCMVPKHPVVSPLKGTGFLIATKTASEFPTVLDPSNAKLHGLAHAPEDGITNYFSGPYQEGELYEGLAYTRTYDADSGAEVLVHYATGVKVWADALDFCQYGHGKPQVLWRYMDRDKFIRVAHQQQQPHDAYQMLLDTGKLFGEGLYTCQYEPAKFGRKQRVILNNFGGGATDPWSENPRPPGVLDQLLKLWGDHADYCVPVLAPEDIAFCIRKRQPPDLVAIGVPLGCDIYGIPQHQNKDVWVIQIGNTSLRENVDTVGADTIVQVHTLRLKKQRDREGASARTLLEMDKLASLMRQRGRSWDAEVVCREALESRCAGHGEQHLDTRQTVHRLALILQDQGRFDEAEQLFCQTLEASRTYLGGDDEETLSLASGLATLLRTRGRLGEAEQMLREVLAGRRLHLGPGHPDTLHTTTSLALLLKARGHLRDAEPFLRQALEGTRSHLGAEHPETLSSLDNLAMLLSARGQLAEAEVLLREELAGSCKKFGTSDERAIATARNLARLLRGQGRTSEAEALIIEYQL